MKIQPNMSGEEKKRQRIYDFLNAETKPKIPEIIGVSLWPGSSPDLKPLDYAMFVYLRLLLGRNGIIIIIIIISRW